MTILDSSVSPRDRRDGAAVAPDALCVFAFLWAAQSLVQLVWFSGWTEGTYPLGWLALVLNVCVILSPSRARLLFAAIAVSTAHYLSLWPGVSNHVKLDGFVSLAILGAFLVSLGGGLFGVRRIGAARREEIVARFRPVLIAAFAIMYYAIFVSKMNADFFDPAVSCMHAMYEAFLGRAPFLAGIAGLFDTDLLFAVFMIVELLLPLLLTFPKTRLLACYLGLPFHLMLGVMGHFSYSSLVIALYAVVALPALTGTLRDLSGVLGGAAVRALTTAARAYVVAFAALFALGATPLTEGPLADFRMMLANWLVFAGLASLLIAASALRLHLRDGPFAQAADPGGPAARPGPLWLVPVLVTVNALSPYAGFKTTGALSMYSNLRTEAGANNHFFMPVVPVFGFQNDLVRVIDASHPEILALRGHTPLYGDPDVAVPARVTYFEFRRAVSRLGAEDLVVTYERGGTVMTYDSAADDNPDPDLAEPHPVLLDRAARFRPVFDDRSYCLH